MTYDNRRDAGTRLAAAVDDLDLRDPVVLGLPRGGVPVAAEVAAAINAPLDVLIVRKLGVPWQPELGFGALGEGDVRTINQEMVDRLGLSAEDIERVVAREEAELLRRLERYRGGQPPVDVRGADAVLVDDGLATGATARAGVEILRVRGAGRVILAVPVGPPDAVRDLGDVADAVVCPESPSRMIAIGEWYRDFSQTTDDEVAEILRRSGSGT